MKRILAGALAAGALVAMVLVAPPASADMLKQNCQAFSNSAGGKSVEICAEVIADLTSPQHRYAKVEFNWLDGPDKLPYAVHVITRFWSSFDDGVHWCNGYILAGYGCIGGGQGNSTFRPLAATDTDASDHYADDKHWCYYHTEVTGEIYWTQTQWTNGQYDTFDFNTGNVDVNTHCSQT